MRPSPPLGPHERVTEAVGLALEYDEVPVVGHPVDDRRGHLVVGEHGTRFAVTIKGSF